MQVQLQFVGIVLDLSRSCLCILHRTQTEPGYKTYMMEVNVRLIFSSLSCQSNNWYYVSSRRDIVVVNDTPTDRLFLRDPDPFAIILAIVDPPLLRESKNPIEIPTLVLAVSCKAHISRPGHNPEF